ncbi:tektin-3-like [Planococcus citri]|uniref:tektin-3-like n=1 Tax=Planococcus citri TaxID=170843 RepID=UPI0031F972A8
MMIKPYSNQRWTSSITLNHEQDKSLMPINRSNKFSSTVDPCYVPPSRAGMELVKFPSLGQDMGKSINTGAIALSSRFTPYEWTQMNLKHYSEADTNRNYAEKLRSDAVRAMRETEEKTFSGQRDTCRRLSERLNDIMFWRNELATELERMLSEIHLLQDVRRALEKSNQDCDPPLHMAQECLYFREGRQGIDMVRDQAEESLLQEVTTLQKCKEKLTNYHQKVLEQLRENRNSQHELELDLKSKESALEIDSSCHHLNNFSNNINYFAGIDKFDQTVSVPESWSENSNRVIQRSQNRRIKSSQLRTESENTMNECANNMWNSWNFTNSALSRRTNEILEAKNKLQMHLHKVQQEIFDVEKSMDMIKRAINDKSNPLKVAQTRLEFRTHRKDIELCRDIVQTRLQKEVEDLQTNIHYLNQKLREAESQHQQLLITRSNLEKDLEVKVNSLFIDREKCLGLRKACPVTTFLKY